MQVFDNLDEMDQFLERFKLPELIHSLLKTEEETLLNFLCEANITLIPKPEKKTRDQYPS